MKGARYTEEKIIDDASPAHCGRESRRTVPAARDQRDDTA
jgi:hypothetical protein